MSQKKKILITGAGGFVGKSLVRDFIEKGFDVFATYHHFAEGIEREDSLHILENVSIELFENWPKVDFVIHTAGLHPHSDHLPTEEAYYRTNLLGMKNMLKFYTQNPPELFVNFSTVSVYGSVDTSALNESSPKRDVSFYGSSKWEAEELLLSEKENVKSISVRFPGILGRGSFNCWLGKVYQKLESHQDIGIYNSEELFNNLIDLEEIHRLVFFLLNHQPSYSLRVNYGAKAPVKIQEIVLKMKTYLNSESKIEKLKINNRSFIIEGSFLEDELGFARETTDNILKRYLNDNSYILV